MKKSLILPILITLCGFINGCADTKKDISPIHSDTTHYISSLIKDVGPDTVYTTHALDGSIIKVHDYSNGEFAFFRDKNKDGWAETRGEGFYSWFVTPKVTSETKMLPNVCSMKEDVPYRKCFGGR